MNDIKQDGSEYDLVAFLRALLDTKVHLLIAISMVTLIYWAAVVVLNFAKPPVHTGSVNFYFTFSGVEDSEYPNKSPFQISDIIAPTILNEVYETARVSEYLDRDQFVTGFTIAPYIPDIDLINAKYDLDRRNLSQADLERMQAQLRQEINKASTSAAQLTFTWQDSSLPVELVSNVLLNVPKVWENYVIERAGVSSYDITMYSETVVDRSILTQMDYLVAFELILDKMRLLQLNIEQILELPNGRVVQDPESKLTAPDLKRSLIDTEKYLVAPLLTPIRNLGISKDPEIVRLYFKDQLLELKRRKSLAERKRNNLENAYARYVNQSSDADTGIPSSNLGSGNVIPQFGTEFLDRIVDLSNAGLDIEFRQNMTNEQIELANELAEIEAEFERLNDVLAALDKRDLTSEQDLHEIYAKRTESELPNILEQLVTYFQISNRIYDTISYRSLSPSNGMFRLVGNEVAFSQSNPYLNPSHIIVYLLVIFLTATVVVPFSMLVSYFQGTKGD
jgi:hypothetical protein